MTIIPTPPVDSDRLDEFLGRFVNDLGATMAAGSVLIGDRLGLYRVLADTEAYSLTPEQQAALTDPVYEVRP